MKYNDNGTWKQIFPKSDKQGILLQTGTYANTPSYWSVVSDESDCTYNNYLYFVTASEVESNQSNIRVIYTGNTAINYLTFDFLNSGGDTLLSCQCKQITSGSSGTIKFDREREYYSGDPYWIRTSFVSPAGLGKTFTISVTLKNKDEEEVGHIVFPNANNGTSYTTSVLTAGEYYSERTSIESNSYSSFSEFWDDGGIFEINVTCNSASSACLVGDTKIATITGPVSIEDVKTGTIVLDKDLNPTEVIKTYSHKTTELYNLILNSGERVSCTYDHRFLTPSGEFIIAKNIIEGTEINTANGNKAIVSITRTNKEVPVYEIVTTANTYVLSNSMICECEAI